MREISAGIIIYRTTAEGPRFLILYHGHNYWNFPKGKIESEEKSFQTAVREVREETGLTRNDLRFNENFKTSENFTFWRNKEKIYKTIVFYLAETTQQRVKLPEQTEAQGEKHEGYGWFTYKEALKVLTKEDSQRVLKQAFNFLRNAELRKKVALLRPRKVQQGQQRLVDTLGQRKEDHPQVQRNIQEDKARRQAPYRRQYRPGQYPNQQERRRPMSADKEGQVAPRPAERPVNRRFVPRQRFENGTSK